MAGGYGMERGIEMLMRDDTVLRADVYRPIGDGPFPALLMRTPYDRSLPIDPAGGPDALRATEAGYALIVQDTRGRFGSDGDFVPFEHEADDGYDSVEWVAAQAWCDGDVGMLGGSYVGYTQWTAASRRPPHLRAIAPLLATSDLHDYWIYEGGAPSLWFNQSWMLAALGPDASRRQSFDDAERADRLVHAIDRLDDHLPPTPGAVDASLIDAGIAGLYQTWLDHPERDDYWRALSPRESHTTIETPSLNVAGWYDCFIGGSLANYTGMTQHGGSEAARAGTRLIVGPWRHAMPLLGDPAGNASFGLASSGAGIDMSGIQLRFMDRWVMGIETTEGAEEAPVKLFIMGANVWRDEPAWPLERAVVTDYHLRSDGRANSLQGDGRLELGRPSAGESPDTFVSDPADPVPTRGGNLCCHQVVVEPGAFDQREIEARDDVLVYSTAPLAGDVEVTGPVSLSVFVSSTAPDFDVTAKLVDVHPDGTARNLCEGIRRVRYREGTDHEKLLTPGEIARIEVDLIATANLFRAGHRIRLEVAASNWPRFDRNPQTGGVIAGSTELRPARQKVFHDAARPSYLRVSIVPT
jgi:putative CocE/NonD family hydrolase